MPHLKLISLFLTLFFSLSAFAQKPHDWMQENYLITSFIDIALNNEYSAAQSKLRKWTKPIKYHFIHRTADQKLHERLSTLHLEHLQKITGVKMQQIQHKQNANLLIIFSKEALLEKELLKEFNISSKKQREQLFRNSVCLAHFSINKNNSIRKAIVIIPVDRARAKAKLVSCIVEELTQIMGLPNDSDKVYPSIFNDRSTDELLSGLDFILLKILYHPKLKAGMQMAQIKRLLPSIIEEFKQQELIQNSTTEASHSGLYDLLY